jgi:putative membrane protein
VTSIFLEAVGVSTGKLFGAYSYSSNMGLAVKNVPLIIGVNWLILVYASNAIVSKFTGNSILRILFASLLMLLYDVVLERIAPILNMWLFENGSPPFRNYLTWFLMAILFQTVFVLARIDSENKPARALFISQLVLFVSIIIFARF